MFDYEQDINQMKAMLDYLKQGRFVRSLYPCSTTTNRFEYLDGARAYDTLKQQNIGMSNLSIDSYSRGVATL